MRLPRRRRDDERPQLIHTVLSLVCMVVNGALGVILLFNLRIAIMTTVDRSAVRVFAINFIDISVSIALCIAWLVFVFVSQYLYEKDFAKSMFPKRFIIFTGAELVLLLAVFLYSSFIL